MNQTEDQLLNAYARGDKRAFLALYDQYKQLVLHYLQRNCRNKDHAEDLFQDIWLKVIANARRFESRGRFRAWLFTLAHHALVDYYRAENRGDYQPWDENRGEGEVRLEAVDLPDKVQEALMTLPLEQRQAFYLRQIGGLSVHDIAEIQGVNEEAAKSRLRYGLTKLRELLKDQAPTC